MGNESHCRRRHRVRRFQIAMWHLVSRGTGPATTTATCDCRSLRPIGTLAVRYIRTWLEVLLNATTCRRSGPTQGSQSRSEQSRRSLVYEGCTLQTPAGQGGLGAAEASRPSSTLPCQAIHRDICTRSRPPFHSTRLTRPLDHSLITRSLARPLTPIPVRPRSFGCATPASHPNQRSH